MNIALSKSPGFRLEGLQASLVYAALLPLCMLSGGVERLGARLIANDAQTSTNPETWFERARSQASIATSYALIARRMLQSSERHSRPERPL